MKILYDCFSCSPYYGSDEGIGWLWPYYMRKYHEVWALVRKDRKEEIERYCNEHAIVDIHFIYADIPDWMNFYYKNKKKGKNGTLDFLAYQFLWQFPAYFIARRIHCRIHFDLVHHVSTNDFRFLGKLYRLGIPFLVGPIGGAQETAEALQDYVKTYRKNELLRTFLNKVMTSLPSYRMALKKAERIFFSNEETQNYLLPHISNSEKCEIMTEVGFSGKIDFEKIQHKKCGHTVTFLWAGRMEYRKGLELLFDSMELLPVNLSWRLILCGDGSERKKYENIVAQKAFSSKVIFRGKVPYEEMQQIYEDVDVFVFPSLRETTGTVIVEAMAHGLPVIALKQGGAARIITEETGYLVSGNTKDDYIKGIASSMIKCIQNTEGNHKMGVCAAHRIQNHYTWETKIESMNLLYQEIGNVNHA